MSRKESALRATLSVTLIIFISKAAGFIREIVVAAYYGTDGSIDAYNSAYSIYYLPILLLNSCITSTMLPIYTEIMEREGIKRANRFASNTLNVFAVFSLIIAAIMFLLAEPLVNLIYFGFSPEKAALTVRLTRIMLPSLIFAVASIIFATLLNAREKFISAQLTGFPLTASIIVATVFFSAKYGIEALAWGVAASAVMQVIILIPGLRGTYRYSEKFNLREKHFRRLMKLALPAMLSMAVNELNHMIDHTLASPLPDGHLSSLRYASMLITFLTGVLVVPLITVTFSKMSKKAVERDRSGLIELIMNNIEIIALVIMPIIAVCAVFSEDIIMFAYMRRAFSAESVKLTAPVFMFYVIGIIGFGVRDLLTRAFNAVQDTKTPMLIAMGTVGLNIVLDIAMVGSMGINGLALATSIAGIAGALALFVFLRRKLGRMGGRRTLEELLKIGIATVMCVATCLMLGRVMPAATSALTAFLRLTVCTLGAVIVYLGVVLAARVRQAESFASIITNRLSKRGG